MSSPGLSLLRFALLAGIIVLLGTGFRSAHVSVDVVLDLGKDYA